MKKITDITDAPSKKRHRVLRKIAKYTAIGTIATAGVIALNNRTRRSSDSPVV